MIATCPLRFYFPLIFLRPFSFLYLMHVRKAFCFYYRKELFSSRKVRLIASQPTTFISSLQIRQLFNKIVHSLTIKSWNDSWTHCWCCVNCSQVVGLSILRGHMNLMRRMEWRSGVERDCRDREDDDHEEDGGTIF